jgi:putative OPT family oligopeptide transporter
MDKQESNIPLIGPEQSLPEITLKVIVLSIILTVILAAANAYLGLKVGTTVSSSIPAAVISMAILRFFRKHNTLENNMVQTAASVGEILTASIAFILPALLVLHYWTHFPYWEIVIISILGGTLGVFMTIPLRRALIHDKTLRFPEGTAIGHVLIASANANTDIKPLAFGGIVGAVIALMQSGLRVLSDSWQFWFKSSSTVWGFGLGFSPALIAAGFIVGPTVAFSLLVGIIISWVIALHMLSPSILAHGHFTHGLDAAMAIWSTRLRYLGVGTMLVGGLWTLFSLFKPVLIGLQKSLATLKHLRSDKNAQVLRTDRDIPINFVGWGVLGVLVLVFFFLHAAMPASMLGMHTSLHFFVIITAVLYILVAGFIFSAISAYFAAMIGSTNNPLSGLLVAALTIFSFILLLLTSKHQIISHEHQLALCALSILVCAVIGAAVGLSNDTMQDLRAGYMVGSTPWKQQAMLLLGVIVAALTIPPILQLLFNAYGMAGVYPHAGMDPSQMLAAPQASMMAAVADGVFTHTLPWKMISAGAVIAIACIVADEVLKRRDLRLPVLAVGLGIYLPLDASTPVVIGGLLALLINSRLKERHSATEVGKQQRAGLQRGLILACGLVAGAAITGVVLAIPFALAKSSSVLAIVGNNFALAANWLSIAVTAGICYWIYRTVVKR